MRFILTLLMTSAMAFGFACQSASTSSTGTKNESLADAKKAKKSADKKVAEKKADNENKDGKASRISLADAKKDFDAGNVVFIDTRSKTAFDNEHVKGALNVPLNDFENAHKSLSKDKKIIAYCS